MEATSRLDADLSLVEHDFQNTHMVTHSSPNVGTLSQKYQEHGMMPDPLDFFSKHTSS